MKFLIRGFFLFSVLVYSIAVSAQSGTYISNGSALPVTCNCYRLTTANTFTSGSVWNATRIDLTSSFDFIFNVYLGCQDNNGADGIVFMLQPKGTSVGASGGGLGFEGVVPSVGVTLDTWQNDNNRDPSYDHISIQTNGDLTHGSDLSGPVQASVSNSNIEDCQWHTLRISWDAATFTLRAYFDGTLRVTSTYNLVSNIFNGDPLVYWGFSAATGGSYNLQQFCTALNPLFTTNHPDNTACEGESITFSNSSESFAPVSSYYWDLGDGTTYNVQNIPPHTYPGAGLYNVKMAIKGFDGCESDTLYRTITIGDYPVASFAISDTCAGQQPVLLNGSTVNVGSISQWNWLVDGNALPSTPSPDLSNLVPGQHYLDLSVTSNHGCVSTPVQQAFELLPVPQVSGSASDGCVNETIGFNAVQVDNATTINSWNWTFEENRVSPRQNVSHIFREPGNYDVQLYATADNGCRSATSTVPVFVNQAVANAGRDTIVIKDDPYQLNGTGGVSYSWSPDIWINDAATASPVVTPQDNITYWLTVTTAEGCVDRDDISLEVFKGSEIYVPTGFSPNNDNINDKLGPYYIGIRDIEYFMIYNRWGQLIFSSRDRNRQWDGTVNGITQPTGVYVWRLAAVDYIGKRYERKGSITLIR
ncbi:MAG: PKD domain-containing protein [Chitinophagaceae bacterium]